MIRLLAAAVVLVLVLSFGAFKQQDAPLTVTCGTVTGGGLLLTESTSKAYGFGRWLHNVADNPEQYRDPQQIKRNLDGMGSVIRKVFLSLFLGANGRKADPHILKLEQARAQAVKDAGAACCPPPPSPTPEEPEADWDPKLASVSSSATRWTSENLRIAQAAVREVRRARMPERAAVVMLAAGGVESRWQSLNYGDRDSIGWLQQRNAWGSRADRLDPAKAARMFLYGGAAGQEGLRDKAWQQMSVGQAAQAVQVSAFPDRYAAYEKAARELIAAVGGFGPAAALPEDPEAPGYSAGGCVPLGESSEVDISEGKTATTPAPGGWDFPNQRSVDAAIGWMRAQDASNSGGWQARCLAAVGQAYGHAGTTQVNGRFWARDQLTAMPDRYKLPTSSNPPRGALVFWDTGRYGHIAISNGDGRVWTTDPPGRTGQIGLVPIAEIDAWGKRTGVAAPYFIGKTGTVA